MVDNSKHKKLFFFLFKLVSMAQLTSWSAFNGSSKNFPQKKSQSVWDVTRICGSMENTHTHAHTLIWMSIHTHIWMSIDTHLNEHTHMHSYSNVHAQTHIHTLSHLWMNMHTRTFEWTHTLLHTRFLVNVRTHSPTLSLSHTHMIQHSHIRTNTHARIPRMTPRGILQTQPQLQMNRNNGGASLFGDTGVKHWHRNNLQFSGI